MHRLTIFAAITATMLPSTLRAQGFEYVKANYTKFEYRIPMRDGVKLFTCVYVPKDDSQTYPILMTRTPYTVGPYGVDQYKENLGPSAHFGKAGYIFAYQDVRGRWMSEGTFADMRPYISNKGPKDFDETSDTYDTIDWLVKNIKGNNGRVGLYGISYPGFYTAAGMIDAHPALKAASPQAPINDWFMGDDWHHNGAFQLPHAFNFMANFGHPRPEPTKKFPYLRFDHGTPDGYEFFFDMGSLANADKKYFKGDVAFWNEVMKHGSYDDFWKAHNLRPHLKSIKPAVMTVGGWFDAENLFGALQTYKNVEANNPPGTNLLVMGPWVHGGWSFSDGDRLGDIRFNAKTSEFYREKIELPFFEYFLKDKSKLEMKHPKAWVFETGTNRWRKFDAWPPKSIEKRVAYFRAGSKLSLEAPEDSSKDAFDEFVSDPAKPVPYIDRIDVGMLKEYMTADQRFAARRPDVLVYQTRVLTEDKTIAGPIEVELHVSTTSTDADWIVKVIDVYPDDYPDNPTPKEGERKGRADVRMGGYQQLVRGDVMRGKFRNSFEKPEPFRPNEPAKVHFTLNDTLHTFRTGHRIMIQVQSSWFPLIDRNPQTFCDIYTAKTDDFHKAVHRVFRSGGLASHITLPVLR